MLDTVPDIGPMAGLLAALQARSDVAWLLLACDMPDVDNQVIDALVTHRNPDKIATVFYTNDAAAELRVEPLCAIYEPACLPWIRQACQEGQSGLYYLLEQMSRQQQLALLDLKALLPERANALQSLNTPDAARCWRLP